MNLSLTSRVVRTSDAITAAVAEELVMMDVETGTYYGLNNVGAEIWRLLESPTSTEDLCTALMHSFDVPLERCTAEVLQFLDQLQAKGLVHVVP
jgi:hypothetical protein